MNSSKHLLTSSILFFLILSIWPVFMALAQPTGEIAEKLEWIMQNQALFKMQFFFAFLIGPSLIYMMFSQLRNWDELIIGNNLIGFIFWGAYLVLCSLSYGLQFTLVPWLINKIPVDLVQVFYFDSEVSLAYAINQMGYFFWALGTFVLFLRFVFTTGTSKTISIIYMLSAFLSLIAFLGLIINSRFLNSMTFVSGILLLPAGFLSIIHGIKIKRQINSRLTHKQREVHNYHT